MKGKVGGREVLSWESGVHLTCHRYLCDFKFLSRFHVFLFKKGHWMLSQVPFLGFPPTCTSSRDQWQGLAVLAVSPQPLQVVLLSQEEAQLSAAKSRWQ